MSLLYRMGTGNGSGGDLKPYTVNFECASGYIGQTLTMTYQGTPHAGEVVDNVSGTVGSDGMLTLYPMHSGIWECSCYSSVTGKTATKTIDLSYWGIQPTVKFGDTLGATVTPTDDVQTWLNCANIWDKSYTTISEVVADTTTLNTLIANENASDYLVRSTTWASDVCNNESAMTYIGLNDYCANKLLTDSTWYEAIYNSPYFEKVIYALVPTMTSNTGSECTLSPSSEWNNNYAWYGFDNNENTAWTNNAQNSGYVVVAFNSAKKVKCISIHSGLFGNAQKARTIKVIASDDSSLTSPITILETTTIPNANNTFKFKTNTDKFYKYYQIEITNTNGGTAFPGFISCQFYGREA